MCVTFKKLNLSPLSDLGEFASQLVRLLHHLRGRVAAQRSLQRPAVDRGDEGAIRKDGVPWLPEEDRPYPGRWR